MTRSPRPGRRHSVRPGRRERSASRRDHSDAGVAAVELAIVLPVLIGVIMLAVVAGTAAVGQLQLEAAARDAARAGSVVTGAECSTALNSLGAVGGDAGPTLGSVTCTPVSVCPGTDSRVTLTATRNVTIPLVGERSIDLRADARFDCQITN